MPTKPTTAIEWVKTQSNPFGEGNFYLPKEDKKTITNFSKAAIFGTKCQKVCTSVIELLPETVIDPGSGRGYFMINIDGYRFINAYVIGERLNSTTQKGFSLQLSFSVNNFLLGVGVVGETSHFFNFDNYYNKEEYEKKIVHIGNSYETSLGGLTHIGGVDYTHLLRMPVVGPYVRASVMNRDSSKRKVKVVAYLTT
jgi:hypothetical protein